VGWDDDLGVIDASVLVIELLMNCRSIEKEKKKKETNSW
jgi:hypothetical protein